MIYSIDVVIHSYASVLRLIMFHMHYDNCRVTFALIVHKQSFSNARPESVVPTQTITVRVLPPSISHAYILEPTRTQQIALHCEHHAPLLRILQTFLERIPVRCYVAFFKVRAVPRWRTLGLSKMRSPRKRLHRRENWFSLSSRSVSGKCLCPFTMRVAAPGYSPDSRCRPHILDVAAHATYTAAQRKSESAQMLLSGAIVYYHSMPTWCGVYLSACLICRPILLRCGSEEMYTWVNLQGLRHKLLRR